MAVHHMVWVRFRPEVPESRIAAIEASLRQLPGRVPGMQSMTMGRNFTDRANGCTHGISVILDDRAALEHYAVDPFHVDVAGALRESCDVLMAVDYEY
ncbi:MAG: Dabb family protein [Gammaproteobacteria bacterium]